MYETFGAVVTGNAVEFRLFFPDKAKDASQYSRGGLPNIKKIQVRGDFQAQIGSQDWRLDDAPLLSRQDHPKGMLYTFRIDHLPDGFYQYKYFVTFQTEQPRWCGDPCTRYVATKDENSAFVVGGNDLTVRPLSNRLPFQDLVIYELMIDDFTAGIRGNQAPVDAVRDKIQYLLDLGVNAIEFMPWTAWRGGEFNWGYDPYLFFAVENRYIEDLQNPLDRLFRLKRLVDELHQKGIHVIMDGVFNQLSEGAVAGTGFPYYWLYETPGDSPYIGGFAGGGFDDEIDYHNGCAQEFIRDVCTFWLDEYQLDGIRFDYSLGYFIPGDTTQGIPQLIADIKAHLADKGRTNVSLMLEHLTDDRYAAIDATNIICATGCWYDRFLFDVPRYAASGNIDTKLMRVLDNQRDFAAGKGPVPYIDNHDHSTVINRVGGRNVWWKVQPPLIALLTASGAVLLRNGQEFGEDAFLPDSGPDRVKPRPLHWDLLQDTAGQSLFSLHQKLIALRKECPSLRTGQFSPSNYDEQMAHFNNEGYGVDVDKDVAIYQRSGKATDGTPECFVIVLNFSDFAQTVDVPFPVNGTWKDRLSGDAVTVGNLRIPNLQVTSHWAKVFYKKG